MTKPVPPMCHRGEPHYWVLGDSAHGVTPAKCRKCRRVRTYGARVDDWNGRLTPRQTTLAHGGRGWIGYQQNDRRLAEERIA